MKNFGRYAFSDQQDSINSISKEFRTSQKNNDEKEEKEEEYVDIFERNRYELSDGNDDDYD